MWSFTYSVNKYDVNLTYLHMQEITLYIALSETIVMDEDEQLHCQNDQFLLISQKTVLLNHTGRARFPNATQFSNFQKQIKPSMERNFATYVHQTASIAQVFAKIREK